MERAQPRNAVELSRVTKTFGEVLAVDDLSLAVPEGSLYGFIGPNGSGKTTTMRMIVNIFYPDSGTVRLFGETRLGARTRWIGYLPEERGLYEKMTVRSMLEFYGELRGGRNVSAEVGRWLEKFELGSYASRKVETLSKGMSQKVQFIAAVVHQPELLILDEPFSGLDPVNLDVLRQAVWELRTRGVTILFSTHDMTMAERMCDFIFMIFRGRKVLDGTLSSIQDRYGADTVRIRADGGAALLRGLPGVEAVDDSGNLHEVRLAPQGDPQRLLAELIQRTRVQSFEVSRPSLHDIFVRIAGNGAKGDEHA
jgi:ABC-2 type transport system ATP-binding protein